MNRGEPSSAVARTCLVVNDRRPVPTDLLDHLHGRLDVEWWQSPGSPFNPAVEFVARPRTNVLVTNYLDLSARHLRLLPRLELVVATTTAVEYIDLDHCRAHGITVCNSADYTETAVAEHAIGLMFAVAKCIVPVHAGVQAGDMLCFQQQSVELAGKTVGVVGMGHIGAGVARLASGMGMRVVFANRRPREVEGSEQVGLNELLAVSDVVFLTLPLNNDSHHLIGVGELALMKSDAILVSVSPDAVIEANALATALASGVIRGAGLDLLGTTSPYPPLDNLVLSPRFAASTRECLNRRQAVWTAVLTAFVAGAELPNRVV